MKKRKLLAIIGSMCIVLGATSCSHMEASTAAVEAESEINKAKAMGNEWRDSKKILEKANKALDDGDVETANKLIAKAKKQGIDAQTQAEAQMDVSGPSY